jgi:hypothetical protein
MPDLQTALIAAGGGGGRSRAYGTSTALDCAQVNAGWYSRLGTLACNLLGCLHIGYLNGLFERMVRFAPSYPRANDPRADFWADTKSDVFSTCGYEDQAAILLRHRAICSRDGKPPASCNVVGGRIGRARLLDRIGRTMTEGLLAMKIPERRLPAPQSFHRPRPTAGQDGKAATSKRSSLKPR